MVWLSSFPIAPLSPACGFKPKIATLGLFIPKSTFSASLNKNSFSLSKFLSKFFGTSDNGICSVARAILVLPEAIIIKVFDLNR